VDAGDIDLDDFDTEDDVGLSDVGLPEVVRLAEADRLAEDVGLVEVAGGELEVRELDVSEDVLRVDVAGLVSAEAM
jgi:hypothetical protein